MRYIRVMLEALETNERKFASSYTDPALSRNFAEIEIDTLVGFGWRKFPA